MTDGLTLGKGAWDCDNNVEIRPDKEQVVFEEVTTTEFMAFGIFPTVPRRKDNDRLAFFCDGCRYRIKASVHDDTVRDIRRRLWEGGLGRGDKMETGARDVIECWEDVMLSYKFKMMVDDDANLFSYGVPPGCKCLIAVDKNKFGKKLPFKSDYWA